MNIPIEILTHIARLSDNVTIVNWSMVSKSMKDIFEYSRNMRKDEQMLKKGDRYLQLLNINHMYNNMNAQHIRDYPPSGTMSWHRIDNLLFIPPMSREHNDKMCIINQLSREYFDLIEVEDTLRDDDFIINIGMKSIYGCTQAINTLTRHICMVYPSQILIPPHTNIMIRPHNV